MAKSSKFKPSENPTILALQAITKDFDVASMPFKDIFETTILPIVDSPYLFNNFHWVTNIHGQNLMYVKGVDKVLGYKDETFTLEKSVEIIHPNYRAFVVEYGLMAYRMLKEPRYQPLSNRSHYYIQYPIKRADGKFILVQMNASVIQTDKDGNPIANYNRFEVLGAFLDVPIFIRPHVYFRTSMQESALEEAAEKDISQRISKIMLSRLKITDRELLTLKDFSDNLNSLETAKKQERGVETVKHHAKKILKKARLHLFSGFRNAQEVAIYLKNIDII